MPSENVIDLVKSLSVGPCTCTYPMASCSMMWDAEGRSTHKSDMGPKQECLRCKARQALESDFIEYVNDDSMRHSMKL